MMIGKEARSLLLPCKGDKTKKSPASEEAGRTSIRLDQSPLRRDQISVKLSSPSPFTSEA